MKITQTDDLKIELRGRQRQDEQGVDGLWLLWLVGSLFVVTASGIVWYWIENAKRGDSLTPAIVAGLIGLLGFAVLCLGVSMSLDREFLTLDLSTRKAIYGHWSPRKGRRTRRKFSFDDVADVTLSGHVEGVSAPSMQMNESSHVYKKLEARLRVRPKTVIVLERSQKEAAVRELAEQVAAHFAVPLVDRC